MYYCGSLTFRPETKEVRGTDLWLSTLIMLSGISYKAGLSQEEDMGPCSEDMRDDERAAF